MALLFVLKISLVIFIAGNLLEMGIKLNLADAFKGLRNLRFVCFTLFWGFAFGPAMAYAITLMVPLDPPLALGLMLLGMTPSAPFLPMLIKRVKGDLGYTASFMLLTSIITVIYIPLVIPFLVEGLTVSPWTIAKPLLFLIILPLTIGMGLLRWRSSFAKALQPYMKKINTLFAISSAALCLMIYGKQMVGIAGSFAVLSQFIFFSVMAAATYWLSIGVQEDERIILSMGMSTRNIGAGLAPLFAFTAVDDRSIIMVMFALPFMIIFSWAIGKVSQYKTNANKPAVVYAVSNNA